MPASCQGRPRCSAPLPPWASVWGVKQQRGECDGPFLRTIKAWLTEHALVLLSSVLRSSSCERLEMPSLGCLPHSLALGAALTHFKPRNCVFSLGQALAALRRAVPSVWDGALCPVTFEGLGGYCSGASSFQRALWSCGSLGRDPPVCGGHRSSPQGGPRTCLVSHLLPTSK